MLTTQYTLPIWVIFGVLRLFSHQSHLFDPMCDEILKAYQIEIILMMTQFIVNNDTSVRCLQVLLLVQCALH